MIRTWPVALALIGCAGERDSVEVTPASFLEVTSPETYSVLDSVGVAPHRIVVRGLNQFGAAVGGDPQPFQVDGTTVSVAFDGGGYGGITRSSPGVAEITGGLETAYAHTVETAWPGTDLHPAWVAPLAEPMEAHPVTQGALVVSGSEVWWSGDAMPTHRVLVADGDILGIRTGAIDVDGFDDAIVWTAGTVYLLQGHRGGGMSWGGALTAGDLGAGGAAMGDLTGDNLPDLAIAWATPDGGGWIDIWQGDGLFGFEAAAPRSLRDTPVDVSVGDNTGEGLAQITVLLEGQDWVRFIQGEPGRFIPIGPLTPATAGIRPGSRLLEADDINDDGADDLPVVAPRVVGERRLIELYDLSPDEEGTPWLPLEDEPGAWVAIEDGDGDTVADVWLLHDTTEILAVRYAPGEVASASFRKSRVFENAPAYGPIAVSDLDLDGAPELFLAGERTWWRWEGRNFPADPERYWEPRQPEMVQVREATLPQWAFAEIDGGPDTIELVTFARQGSDTELKLLQYQVGGGRAAQLGDAPVAPSTADIDDLAVCGDQAFVIAGGVLSRVLLSNPADPTVTHTRDTTGLRVDCGQAPAGATVALLEAGEVVLLNNALGDVGSPVSAPGAQDLAIGDLGSGPEVQTCATDGCRMAVWPWGASGEVAFVAGDADGLTLIEAAGETPLGGSGAPSVGDLDGDGNVDLVALGGRGLLTLHRSTGASVAPAELLHYPGEWQGLLAIRDGDGDGWADLWGVDLELDLKYTQPPIEEVEEPPEPTDTGDTGTTAPDTADTGGSTDTSVTPPTVDTADTGDTGA